MLLIPTKVKVVASLLVVGGAFYAGLKVNDWHRDSELVDALQEQSAEILGRYAASMNRIRETSEAERTRRINLERELAADRAAAAAIREDIANADLSESRPADPVEAGNHSCPTPLASPDFIRLWNSASGGNH